MTRRRPAKRKIDFLRVAAWALEVDDVGEVTDEALVELFARGPLLDVSASDERVLAQHYVAYASQLRVRRWARDHELDEPWIETRMRMAERSS